VRKRGPTARQRVSSVIGSKDTVCEPEKVDAIALVFAAQTVTDVENVLD
jgi:hypothetical protein